MQQDLLQALRIGEEIGFAAGQRLGDLFEIAYGCVTILAQPDGSKW